MEEILAGTNNENGLITLEAKCFQPIIFHKAMRKPANAKTAITAITISNEFGLLDFPHATSRKDAEKIKLKPRCQTQDSEKLRFFR
jgi:hypothetical protein